jgi:hypothetical protein
VCVLDTGHLSVACKCLSAAFNGCSPCLCACACFCLSVCLSVCLSGSGKDTGTETGTDRGRGRDGKAEGRLGACECIRRIHQLRPFLVGRYIHIHTYIYIIYICVVYSASVASTMYAPSSRHRLVPAYLPTTFPLPSHYLPTTFPLASLRA